MRAPWGLVLLLAAAAASRAQCTPDQAGRAESLFARQNLDAAEALAKTCDSSGPRSLPFKVLLGEIAFRKGRVEDAERAIRDAIALDPNSARAWFDLGRISECSFNRKAAEDCFRRAHELAPNAAAAVLHWAMALQGPEAEAAFQTYLDLVKDKEPRYGEEARALLAIRRALGGRPPFGLVSGYGRAEIRLEPVMRGGELRAYRIPVSIGGGGPVKLLLDTGASGIVLNASLAGRFHVQRAAATTVRGLGDTGDIRGYVGVAGRVRIGGVEFRDAVVTVGEGPSIAGEQGLLGTDVFDRFLVTLNLPRGVLRLEPFSEGEGDGAPADRGFITDPEFERVYRLGHSLLIPTSVSGSDPVMFVLDTGASQTLVARDFAAELARMRSASGMPLRGLSGKINDVDAADDLKFAFGRFSVRCLDTLSVDLRRHDEDMGMRIGGFLGFPILKMFSVTIDYRNGLIKLECPTAQSAPR
jgi:predicted aspartyl protease